MLNWVNKKSHSVERINILLEETAAKGQWTNGGPLVVKFEQFIRKHLQISDTKAVIAVNNATSALHALVSGIEVFHSKDFNWATQSFTFPPSCQGPLKNAKIIDITDDLGPDLDQVGDCNGLVVTNLFGNITNISKYETWASQDKILIYDNAATPYTFYNFKNCNNYGTGSVISFHHTKPFGFGEGGAIIVDKKYETSIRNICNFGISNVLQNNDINIIRKGSNYKISDIAAAFILDYLNQNFYFIINHHRQLYLYMQEKVKTNPKVEMLKTFSNDVPFVSCLAITSTEFINEKIFIENGIYCRKYYNPLLPLPESVKLWKSILCFPCHTDMTYSDIDHIIEILDK